jgi:hypothetical protein
VTVDPGCRVHVDGDHVRSGACCGRIGVIDLVSPFVDVASLI